MKCKFCGAEVELGKICEYCGSRAEKEYYHTQEVQKRKQERQPRKQRTAAQTYTVKKGIACGISQSRCTEAVHGAMNLRGKTI